MCILAESGTLTHEELGANFALEPSLIRKWLAAQRGKGSEAFRGRGIRTELEAEVAQLRKENGNLKQERKIVKKSGSVLCQESSIRYALIALAQQEAVCFQDEP